MINSYKKGTWSNRWALEKELGTWIKKRSGDILFCCPGCGLVASLSDHKIDENGRVTPSVDCPDCEFHEFIKLKGWKITWKPDRR